MRTDAIRTKLSDAILAPMLAAGPQRKVQEIWMQEGASESLPGAVRVRHILYSPNGDSSTASTVAEDDPAWDDAKAKADAAYAKLKADIDQFDAVARAESDEDRARESGGKLPYFAVSDSIDPAFASAIFTGGPEAGELLEPVRSSFGWHVIQVMHYPTDMEWANKLKVQAEQGADFGTLARDNSDRPAAADGGDMGWIGKGMLDPTLEAALFAAKVGGVSDPVKVDGDGVYLYRVVAEETREPDEEQKRTLESTAFSRWYGEQKALFQVTREAADTAAEPAAG
jgi:parvulin-like peptidyl-prolyl isomerase